MLEGLLSVRKLRNPGLFIFSTILIWVLYYLRLVRAFLLHSRKLPILDRWLV